MQQETIMKLYASVLVNLNSPGIILGSEGSQITQKLINSNYWQETGRGFSVAMEKARVGDFGISANEYFKTVTEVVTDIIAIQMAEKRLLLADIDTIKTKSVNTIWTTIGIFAGMILGMFIIIIPVFNRIVNSIQRTILAVKDIANGDGDLTQRVTVSSRDEVGELSSWMNIFIEKIQTIIKEIALSSEKLTASSSELSGVSNQLAAAAEETGVQSEVVTDTSQKVSVHVRDVASAARQSSEMVTNIAHMTEEMSSNFQEMARFAKEIVVNVESVASASDDMSMNQSQISLAVEQMTSSLNYVAVNTSKSNQIAREASHRTDEIKSQIDALVKASKQIGMVIDIIKDIADKTNMLALNATIQASGAGEAGKGFAVVAGEVKDLARQSSEATAEIAKKIQEIQTSTEGTEKASKIIHQIITEIATISETIAAAVEEQSATAANISKSLLKNVDRIKDAADKAKGSSELVGQISRSIDESSKASQEVTKNIVQLSSGVSEVARSSEESSKGVEEISNNIQMISQAAKETAKGAAKTSSSSVELSRMAKQLADIIGRFRF